MNSLLEEILTEKRREVERLWKDGLTRHGIPAVSPLRDFRGAVCVQNHIGLIAEIKFASPSTGMIRRGGNLIPIARMYERAGAAAISILTDKQYFNGEITNLLQVKRTISLPILRKDFILEEIQVEESRLWGADAVLLIARILSAQQLERLLKVCRSQGLAALTEIHDREELETAVGCGAEIIGINNRNLETFEVDLETTFNLAPHVPEGCTIVSESGIKGRQDVELLKMAGIQAVLVGTALMKSKRIEAKAEELAGCSVA